MVAKASLVKLRDELLKKAKRRKVVTYQWISDELPSGVSVSGEELDDL
nr:hypothetical protein [Bacillota bacterium]